VGGFVGGFLSGATKAALAPGEKTLDDVVSAGFEEGLSGLLGGAPSWA